MTDIDTASEVFGTGITPLIPHNLDPTHKKILLICHDCPDAINDRPLLLAKFYQPDWDNTKTLYQNFTRLTRPETVTRRFRDLREWGYVKENKQTDKRNYEAMKSERERHSPMHPVIAGVDFSDSLEKLDNLTTRPTEQTSLL